MAPAPAPSLHPLAQVLNRLGVTPKVAAELVRDYPAERVEAKIDLLEWLQEQKPDRVNEPGAWLVHAIRDDYSPPKGYRPKAEREAKKKAAAEARRKAEEDRRLRRRGETTGGGRCVAIEDYWNRLSPDERSALETRDGEV